MMRSICSKNSFFFVRTCDNSSLRADILICLFITLLYHICAFFALCGVALDLIMRSVLLSCCRSMLVLLPTQSNTNASTSSRPCLLDQSTLTKQRFQGVHVLLCNISAAEVGSDWQASDKFCTTKALAAVGEGFRGCLNTSVISKKKPIRA